MKLKVKSDFATPERRQRLVELIAHTVNGRAFTPYLPNETDDTFWTVDEGNNWKVYFPPEELACFEVRYRYARGNPEFEPALSNWLAIRLGAEVLANAQVSNAGAKT